MPVAIVGHFRMPPECLAKARPLMIAVMEGSRAEAGCIEYNYAEDLIEPGLVRISEVWESREHLRVHFQTEHMQRWITERAELGLFDRSIHAFEAGSAEPL